jgi:hypothetical protein
MRIIILILCFAFSSCVKSQIIGIYGEAVITPLVIISGESNAGGEAENSDATSPELAPRTNVKIINSYTLLFETLDIGTNNILDHQDIDDAPTSQWHGWELQIANRKDAGTAFGIGTLHMVKTGQGSSTIAQWNDGGTYYTKFKDRVDAAVDILEGQGKTLQLYLIWSQGLNDMVAGTSVATWKAATIAHFEKIRLRYGSVRIIMTQFNDITGTSAFNTAIAEICAELDDCHYVSTAGAPVKHPVDNPYHWNYSGMKQIADDIVDKIKDEYY